MRDHVWYKHEGACPNPGVCQFCDGGLALCVVCRGAEGSLPTECPGEPMTKAQEDEVYRGVIDFRNGKWIKVS